MKNEENFTLFLEGGLGAGKTFLVRELLKHFGIEGEVTSPTYTFVNEYQKDIDHAKTSEWHHFDFYRMEHADEFFARGFDEIAEDKRVAKFVEWGEKLPAHVRNSFSGTHYVVKIKHTESVGMRQVKVLGRGEA
ncbi:tRNA (adenosine(37)-N6)-threonylcarbamoyltransferase complex ATPase subunit type 1 TsaE [Candidatus Gracilibacteria bacterium]|nr:tRNA (adenosine(37)-N6)-threonylcarbamoyltransferase complex ATPase subunit type 1 TsaE [Candidatus Gracilibacteria bacterium]